MIYWNTKQSEEYVSHEGGNRMTEKKEKYYACSVGIDSDNKLFLILPNGESINITPEQLFQLKKLYKESRK